MLCISVVAFGAVNGVALASDSEGDGRSCPVSWQTLRDALRAAKADRSVTTPGAFGNNMWGVVVNRTGAVCAVAFSGSAASDQWLLSRQIAAAKAFTANGLSLDSILGGSKQLSTQQLYDLVQPGGGLYGVHFGNIQDAADATKGPASKWGAASDPMVGLRVAGMITFGGGLALVNNRGVVVGGLGISGDTACQDDKFARAVRTGLGLNGGVADAGTGATCR
ncbi:heme-binding protein [Methylocystis parvus]|uniref:Heme-binding protein n=2 Tax=Methylocystis parvus TaxID=134 RepID=A0A6B8MAL0_9HYPH|nr:heme-binding protein [Methylocystis parvus]